jgi:uncharacterized membrane protein
MAAMQAINVTVITPLFMLALFGTGAACLVLAGYSLVAARRPETPYLLAGGLFYVLGNVVVTIVFSVSRNNALARVRSDYDARCWSIYGTTSTARSKTRSCVPPFTTMSSARGSSAASL